MGGMLGYVGGRHGPREVRGAAGIEGARDQNGTKQLILDPPNIEIRLIQTDPRSDPVCGWLKWVERGLWG